MKTTKEFIESGILEQYVLGNTTVEESTEIEQRAATDAEIRKEIDAISEALELYAMENAIPPNELIKPFLLATIDYTERLENGEEVTHPPLLNESSTIEDYLPWINRTDMKPPSGDLDLFAKIIGYTPAVSSAIVWINEYAPHEVHDHEYERFLIVEGTCEIIVEEEVHQLKPSDYFAIPLHKKHMIKVTSSIPCKVILQRIAA